jgi:hypothetical protein
MRSGVKLTIEVYVRWPVSVNMLKVSYEFWFFLIVSVVSSQRALHWLFHCSRFQLSKSSGLQDASEVSDFSPDYEDPATFRMNSGPFPIPSATKLVVEVSNAYLGWTV